MDEMNMCGHYVGPGYVSNWGIENNSMRCRRRRLSEEPPLTAAYGNRKYLKSSLWTEPAEMKRKRRLAKYKSYAMEMKVKTSMRRGLHWLKNKCGKKTHKC